jgi:hypothetical protein
MAGARVIDGRVEDPRGRWLRRLWPVSCAVLFAALAARRLHDGDFFWHLAFGRSVLEAHTLTVPEPLTIADFESTSLAHSWLWDALLYRVYSRFGFVGVSWLVLVVATLAGTSFGLLVTRWHHRDHRTARWPIVFVSTALVTPLLVTRLNERPECVTLVMWPLALLLARDLADESTLRGGLPRAALLAALGFVWAQVHLSVFAYAAAMFILLARRAVGASAIERVRALTLALALAATLATPHGPGLFIGFLRHPVGVYITQHVPEWMPLRWEMLDPTDPENVQGPAYAILLLAPLIAAWRVRRRCLTEILLALLGLAFVMKGRRSVTPAALLSVPLAVIALDHAFGRSSSSTAKALRVIAVVTGLAMLVRTVRWVEEHEGTLLRLGLEEGAYPVGAARLLRDVPGEHRALTTYRTGPPIAFETRGRVRDFVDSRTPLGFTEANLSSARATWGEPRALGAAVRRWGFDLAIVDRAMPVCEALQGSDEWTLALVEPAFATFTRVPVLRPSGLRRIVACGTTYLAAASCEAPLEALDAEIEQEARFVSPAFASQLRAERLLRCAPAGARFDGDGIQALLPRPEDASGFEAARDALEAWLFALAHRAHIAAALLEPHVERGRSWVLADSLPILAKGGADPELRQILERVVEAEGDTTSDAVIVALANTCARLGDAGCASIHAARAAVLGRPEVAPALCFLRTLGASPEARADAEKWLGILHVGCGS